MFYTTSLSTNKEAASHMLLLFIKNPNLSAYLTFRTSAGPSLPCPFHRPHHAYWQWDNTAGGKQTNPILCFPVIWTRMSPFFKAFLFSLPCGLAGIVQQVLWSQAVHSACQLVLDEEWEHRRLFCWHVSACVCLLSCLYARISGGEMDIFTWERTTVFLF